MWLFAYLFNDLDLILVSDLILQHIPESKDIRLQLEYGVNNYNLIKTVQIVSFRVTGPFPADQLRSEGIMHR